MTFTPLFLSELNNLGYWCSLWLATFIYPQKHYTFNTYCSSVLDSVTNSISALQTVVCRWWDIYGCIVLYVCRAAHSPVTSPKASGKAGIIMEARPSQQCLTLDFNTAVVNKGPSQLLVPAITGSRGKLLSFISGDHSYSEAGTHFPVLGYLQHDSLDDTVDKNLTVLGSQGWFHPWGSSELNDSSGSSKHRAATPTSMPWHLTASASTGRAGTAEITPTTGSACYSQGKQRVNPDPHIFVVAVGNNYNANFTVKQQW